MSGFRARQVCGLAGISYRQLDTWTRAGIVRASVDPSVGTGTYRLFSFGDVVELRVIKLLLATGLPLSTARLAVEQLRQHRTAQLEPELGSLVITDQQTALVCSPAELAVELGRQERGVLTIVPLASVVEEIRQHSESAA